MDVVDAEQARIAESSGAVAVMALERVPADIRAEGGVARMSNPGMIEEIKSAPLLNGFRGMPACDKKALRKLLVKCSEIIEAYPDIQEMDLNPVISHEKGLSIVDARIILTAQP
jgi:acyl-CoA synthetase (NDP forming)